MVKKHFLKTQTCFINVTEVWFVVYSFSESKKESTFNSEKDEYGADHMSEIHIAGRIVLNIWRLMRHEVGCKTEEGDWGGGWREERGLGRGLKRTLCFQFWEEWVWCWSHVRNPHCWQDCTQYMETYEAWGRILFKRLENVSGLAVRSVLQVSSIDQFLDILWARIA